MKAQRYHSQCRFIYLNMTRWDNFVEVVPFLYGAHAAHVRFEVRTVISPWLIIECHSTRWKTTQTPSKATSALSFVFRHNVPRRYNKFLWKILEKWFSSTFTFFSVSVYYCRQMYAVGFVQKIKGGLARSLRLNVYFFGGCLSASHLFAFLPFNLSTLQANKTYSNPFKGKVSH